MTWRIITADVLDGLAQIEAASIDCVVSSPPYNVGIDYGEVSDSLDWFQYFVMAERVSAELYRVLKPSGRLWWNTPPVVADEHGERVMLQDEWACMFRNAGFNQRDQIAWISARGAGTAWGSWQSPSAPNLRGDWEAIGVFYKAEWQRARPEGAKADDVGDWPSLCSNVWKVGTEHDRTHPAPFPLEIPSRCIRLSTWLGDTIVDPFSGSGTTGVAAVQNGRNYVGIELNPAYVAMSERRLANTQPGWGDLLAATDAQDVARLQAAVPPESEEAT